MRGSQEPLLSHSSSYSSNNGLTSSNDTLDRNKALGYDGPEVMSEASEDTIDHVMKDLPEKIQHSFDRRCLMQYTNSLNRNFSAKQHRRGSIPCMSNSTQSSPSLIPKKSITSPNPFPELINSPPSESTYDHYRSSSYNTGDLLLLDQSDLGLTLSGSSPLTNGTGSKSSENVVDGVKSSRNSPPPEPHSRYKSLSIDSDKQTMDYHRPLCRNTSLDARNQPPTGASYDSRYTSDRNSPTHSNGRSSPGSESVIYDQASALVTPNGFTKQMLKIYIDDKNAKTVTIDEQMKATDVCRLVIRDDGHIFNKNFALVESITKFDLERTLEDHELVYAIYRSWSHLEQNRFRFVKDSLRYDILQNAGTLPAHMFENMDSDPKNSPKPLPKTHQRQASILLKNLLLENSRLPDVQGFLQLKEAGRKTWKKHLCVLRPSGLYYSTKAGSKDPKHLVVVSHLNDVNIYTANNAKKKLGAPNNYCFCLKAAYCVSDAKELRLFCAEDEASRQAWASALRLVKYGEELKDNFRQAVKHEARLQSIENREAVHRTYGKLNPAHKSRVAMDFTGSGGRVVQDPNEALGVALQEGQHLRKKAARVDCALRAACYGQCGGGNPTNCHKLEAYALHITQPWFHARISREQAVHAIHQQGMCDGVFLVRESQTLPGSYVLSLAHGGKVRHCTIKTYGYSEEMYYSMDEGQTRFLDLVQLIDFYQLNANGLPCRLTDYVYCT